MPKRKRGRLPSKKNSAKKTKTDLSESTDNSAVAENVASEDNGSNTNTAIDSETPRNAGPTANFDGFENIEVDENSDLGNGELEEFVFAPCVQSPNREPNRTSNSSTHVSVIRNAADEIGTHSSNSSKDNTNGNSSTVEIIDVDKLPDRPDSPIGDDVVEITSIPASNIVPRPEQGRTLEFVDLTFDDNLLSPIQARVRDGQGPSSSIGRSTKYEGASETVGDSSRVEASPNSSFPDVTDEELPDVSRILKPADEKLVTDKPVSPTKNITCPICMEDVKQISKANRQLMSTYCGHVFCKECVLKAIETQGKCPKCRQKLTKKKIHPIFI